MAPPDLRRTAVAAVVALTLTALVSSLWPPAAVAAQWVAVDTVSGSGLALTQETWEATPVDYDQDGDEDVWVGYHDQGGRLYSNDGNGTYSRVASGAWPRVNSEGKIPDRHACAWADVDLNGLLDSYCAAGRGTKNLLKTGKDNELWMQTSAGQFTDVGTQWGVGEICGRSHYVAFLDANGDDYPDLFVGNAEPRVVSGDPCDNPANGLPDEQNTLFLNQGGTGFTAATTTGIGGYGGSRCAEVADVNGDGWDDLLVCGAHPTRLYRNNQGSGFTEVAAASRLTGTHADAAFGDLDGDGDLDLVTAMWGRIDYRLNTNGTFAPPVRAYAVPTSGGGRSVTVGDADGDGDLDVYALVSNASRNTNPNDVVLLNDTLRFTPVAVPGATGIGDAVTALDGNADGRSEFLVLNGLERTGPTQRIELSLQ